MDKSEKRQMSNSGSVKKAIETTKEKKPDSVGRFVSKESVKEGTLLQPEKSSLRPTSSR